MRRILLFPLVVLCAWPAHAASEGRQKLIKLNVGVTDAKGDPVTDLNVSDVQLKEDGKPHNIAFFRFEGSKRPLPTPGSGEVAAHSAPSPTVLLLDRWNERIITTAVAWTELSQAVKKLETADGVYVYILSNHGELLPVRPIPATEAEAHAETQVSSAQLAGMLDDAVKKMQGFRDVDQMDPFLRFNTTFKALSALGQQLATVTGRKNLIWLTHGVPLTVRLPGADYQDFTPQIRALSVAAAQAGIALYAVDQSGAGAGATPDLSRETLQMLSNLTGGRWFASDAIETAMAGASADARGNYTVAYYAPISEKDKKFHKIHLESARKGLHFQTRDGRFGDTPEPQTDALEAAVFDNVRRSPLDATEIGLRVALTSDPATKTEHFRIHVDPADVLLESADQHHRGHLSLMLASYAGGVLNGASPPINVDVNLTEEQFKQAEKEGLLMTQDIGTSEKTQRVRVIVFDRELHAVGSATVPIATPSEK